MVCQLRQNPCIPIYPLHRHPPLPSSKNSRLSAHPMPAPYPLAQKPRLDQAVAQAPIQLTDNLGKYALASESLLKVQGWEILVVNTKGHSNLQDNIGSIPHPSARILNHYRNMGAPIMMKTALWSWSQRDADIKSGCHPSANEYK